MESKKVLLKSQAKKYLYEILYGYKLVTDDQCRNHMLQPFKDYMDHRFNSSSSKSDTNFTTFMNHLGSVNDANCLENCINFVDSAVNCEDLCDAVVCYYKTVVKARPDMPVSDEQFVQLFELTKKLLVYITMKAEREMNENKVCDDDVIKNSVVSV